MRSTSPRELQHCTAAPVAADTRCRYKLLAEPRHGLCLASSVRTSSSDVGVKSRYQSPTATKGSGERRQITSSASSANSWQVDGRAHRNGHDDARRLLLTDGGHRRAHRRTGGEAVVDEDDRLVGEWNQRPGAAIETFATFELDLLTLGDPVDHVLRNTKRIHDVVIDQPHTAAGDGAHRQFFMPRNTQFAHHKHVKMRPAGTWPPRNRPERRLAAVRGR